MDETRDEIDFFHVKSFKKMHETGRGRREIAIAIAGRRTYLPSPLVAFIPGNRSEFYQFWYILKGAAQITEMLALSLVWIYAK